MAAAQPILIRVEGPDGYSDSPSSDPADPFDHDGIYPALPSSLSDVSDDRWRPHRRHGFSRFVRSWLGGPLHRVFRCFWIPQRSREFDAPDYHYSDLLPPGYDEDSLSHSHGLAAEPSQMALILDILRVTLFSSWLNLLLFFVPLGYVSYLIHLNPTLTFLCNSLAIVPLSSLLTEATERIAKDAGDTVGAILNISLGNLVELILFVVALKNNQIRVVQASILGSILVNLLLILGSALLATRLPDQEFGHYAAGTQLLGCLLFVSVFAFLMPTAFDYTFKGSKNAEKASLNMSRISAVIILLIYIVYFVHEIKYRPTNQDVESLSVADEEGGRPIPMATQSSGTSQYLPLSNPSSGSQPLPPRTIRFADENESGEEGLFKVDSQTEMENFGEPDGESNEADIVENRGRKGTRGGSVYNPARRARTHSRSVSLTSSHGGLSREASLDGERAELMMPYLTTRQILRDSRIDPERMSIESRVVPYGPNIDRAVSAILLILTSALMSVSAEFLASTIDDVTHQGHLSESLIGLIILPLVGNVAEYATVVVVAARDKMGLALAVSVGSSIQIALCVTPLTVIAGWIMHRPLVLAFSFFEIATLLGSVLLVNLLILGEGISGPLRNSGLKGGLMCACYVIIGVGAYLSP